MRLELLLAFMLVRIDEQKAGCDPTFRNEKDPGSLKTRDHFTVAIVL